MRSRLGGNLATVLAIVVASSMQPTGSPAVATAERGASAGMPATAYVDCPVTPPVLADPPEPEQPAGMARDPLGLAWWYISGDGLPWVGAEPYRETGGAKVLWLKPIGATLTVTGHPLDAGSPTLTAHVPDGYSGDYQASGISFPTAGCWEVTARADNSALRFVTYIVEDGEAPPSGQP
ncbi:MAG: hypothetical protein M3464_07325 [Chloroflexota bacterium]|nr:hypothetical protein [Chloroflexota bacterium]